MSDAKVNTKSQAIAADVAALLRARNPLIWIATREEARVERYLIEACAAANYAPRVWDVARGIREMDGSPLPGKGTSKFAADPGEAIDEIEAATRSANKRHVWIMRDLPVWLAGPQMALTLRGLRNLVRSLPSVPRDKAQAVIVLSPSADVPPELAGDVTVIDWPLPDRVEIGGVLSACIDALPEKIREEAAPNGQYDKAIDAAVGLSEQEAQNCYAKSLVMLRRIDPAAVAAEKKRVISKARVMEWFDPLPGGLDAVGGLDGLKAWLKTRFLGFGKKAREFGLPAPKGVLLVGVPGCGKSLTAKAIATAGQMPLIRLDMNALKSKFVGESEQNFRKAIQTVEAIGRCVLWVDEIEKALAGATQGAADGGVSSDALGTLLSWMQDRTSEAFIVATANDVSSLPPELLRKGRFDELFFVDLPTHDERMAILQAALRTVNRTVEAGDLELVARRTDEFTGAEIAALVPDALYTAFADGGRDITSDDLIAAASQVAPLAKMASEKITRLREWAKPRCRSASTAQAVKEEAPRLRALDL